MSSVHDRANPDLADGVYAPSTVGVRHLPFNFLDSPRTGGPDPFVGEILPRVDRAGTWRGPGSWSGAALPMVGSRARWV